MPGVGDKFSRLAALKPARPVERTQTTRRAPEEADSIARLLGAEVASNHFGEHLAVRNWYATPEFFEPSRLALDLLTRKPDASRRAGRTSARALELSPRKLDALHNPEKWLFLDTETTGLAGGTGTYAFLIGLAWWDAGGLQVEQLFMRDFAEEHSMLQELAARLEERPVLVTFNGKTFDWPLLENRFTMTRSIKAPEPAAHLDLLHPARALWKLRLGSVRLMELERHVLDAPRLGWHREDDVSGAMIPQYYFDYLRGFSAQPLVGVVRHNQMDLRGLAALYGKIDALLDERAGAADSADSRDLFGLSRFLNRRGEDARAHSTCAKAVEAGLPAEYKPQATRELATIARRRGQWDVAAAHWQELVFHPSDGVFACEQLAIHFERKAKDLSKAIEFAQLGLAKAASLRRGTRDPYVAARVMRQEERFLKRIARLSKKQQSRQSAKPPLAKHAAATRN